VLKTLAATKKVRDNAGQNGSIMSVAVGINVAGIKFRMGAQMGHEWI
jgi:hypothetical protein